MMRKSNMIKALIEISIISMSVIYINGCKAPTSLTDTSNPNDVARAFIAGLLKNDTEEAVKYIIPEQRADFNEALKEGIPPLPKDPDILVIVKKNGIQADVRVLNSKPEAPGVAPFGFDMELSNGKWWIVK